MTFAISSLLGRLIGQRRDGWRKKEIATKGTAHAERARRIVVVLILANRLSERGRIPLRGVKEYLMLFGSQACTGQRTIY